MRHEIYYSWKITKKYEYKYAETVGKDGKRQDRTTDMRKLFNFAQIPSRNRKVWKWQGWLSAVLFWGTLKQKLNLNWNEGFFQKHLSGPWTLSFQRPEPRSRPPRCPALHFREIEGCVQGSAKFTIIVYMITHICWKSQLHWDFPGTSEWENRSSDAGRKATFSI